MRLDQCSRLSRFGSVEWLHRHRWLSGARVSNGDLLQRQLHSGRSQQQKLSSEGSDGIYVGAQCATIEFTWKYVSQLDSDSRSKIAVESCAGDLRDRLTRGKCLMELLDKCAYC